ncbi:hypothetical protein [Mesorhizobium huakuii]|uniref:hypothetical protein n=1 Tax=Mesorhizobium huakuii TaxID=28104 RepID=UPI001FD42F1C|nr:hypothetical protein [Mesorhizobium huakuii]
MAATIKLSAFTGEQPRIIPRLMPESAAQSAVNTRLDDGALTPMRKSAFIATAGAKTWKTIYHFLGQWIGWTTVVNAAPGPVADDRLYFTGSGKPKVLIAGTTYDLAVPLPAAALTATLSGTGAGDIVSRNYVYTWVTSFGEESEPNPISNTVDWKPGNSVILSGFVAAPAGRSITLQRIYRSQTGQSGTYLYLIDERAASASNYTDVIAVNAFQEPLPSANYNAPPDDLTGLISLPNGMMAAFSGRKLYFSEPYRPHAWPEKYILTTDSDIVGLGAMDTSIVVMTEGWPQMVQGSSPDTMQMAKLEQNFPCINARGIVDLGYAIAFPSNEGMAVVRADGSISVPTANIFNRDDWLALSPATMIGSQISGRCALFYQTTAVNGTILTGALLLDLSGQSFLIRTDTKATAAYFEIATGGLFFLEADTTNIRRLDAPNAARLSQYWKSKQFVLPYPENFSCIIVDSNEVTSDQDQGNLDAAIAAIIAANKILIAAGSIKAEINARPLNTLPINGSILARLPAPISGVVSVGVYADGKLIFSVTRVNQPVRLPGGFRARTWEIDVFGDVQVQQIVMAKTMDDLKVTA